MYVSVCYPYVTRKNASRRVCFRVLLVCYLSRVVLKNLYPVFRTHPLWGITFLYGSYSRVSSPVHTLVLKWGYPCEKSGLFYSMCRHATVAKVFMTVLWPPVFISLFTILTSVLICPFSRFTDKVVLRTLPIKMRGSIAFLCCLAVASGFVLKFDGEMQWQAWKSFHGKAYSTESEEAARKAIWKDNLGVRNGSVCEIPG